MSVTRIMAAINVSPESFFKGSVASDEQELAKAVRRAVSNGAELIDIGAMSTAPYKETQISEEEEVNRISWATKIALENCGSAKVSIDTQRTAVARRGLELGAHLINDVSGLLSDEALAPLCAEKECGVILMANESQLSGLPSDDVISTTNQLFERILTNAAKAGIHKEKIILDPGIGFFRSQKVSWEKWDLEVLQKLDQLETQGCPLLIGASRKSFIGKLLNIEKSEDRFAGSLAIASWCALKKVDWLRVHDIRESSEVVRMMNLLDGLDRD